MSTSCTITKATPTIGSIPITTTQPPALTRLMTPNASDKEQELELEMEHTRERMRVLKEKRKAEEEAKRKAEEEAAMSCRGGEAATLAGDPNDSNNGSDGGDDEDDRDEKAPCERCRIKKIPCLQQEGKQNTVICKSCHDSKQREGGSGERLAIMESQLAQGLTDVRSLWEAKTRTNQYLRQILRRQDEAVPRVLKRRRVEEETEDDEEEEEKNREGEEEEQEKKKDQGGEEGEEEEEEEPMPKKARSVKGKERAE
ncbi:hypothetical protein F5876DRAFT_74984 [Lentinula aff. lateritia]|uniref:Uncharacterized protein n=1 Tax=Lentinula aff. lateritia TaxID=2804960 RepID=A0ACC1U5M4_9AGAR|nr:hypothetical protein F5876DRAFT_74984 [Lentinula aff. lateritia]